MPFDKGGKFHLNNQRAAASDRMGAKPEPSSVTMPKGMMAEKGSAGATKTVLHNNGDGTFHTEMNGQKTEHPHIGHALVHMGSQHAPGGHFHAHHDGGMVTTHHSENGKTDGPSEHDTVGEAADHMKSMMGDDNMASAEDTGADSGDDYSGM